VVKPFSHSRGGKKLRNKWLGVLIFALALAAMVAYFWLLFLAPEDAVFLGKTPSEWAILIPVLILVYVVLFVLAWVGWALATTAPPLPLVGKTKNEEY
jgi:Na+/H+ antiporter NhaC